MSHEIAVDLGTRQAQDYNLMLIHIIRLHSI